MNFFDILDNSMTFKVIDDKKTVVKTSTDVFKPVSEYTNYGDYPDM